MLKLKLISAILAGCFWLFQGVTLSAQEYIYDSLTIDGLNRTYRLYIPASYDGNESVPLLFNLHGYGSNRLEQLFYGDFRSIADTANFIIACPDGTPDLVGTLSWNNFGIGTTDDISFFDQFITFLSSQYNIDADRIYSTGMSNGGFMSHDLACLLSSKITAIASVTGSMNVLRINDCTPPRPVPVMQIHGTADETVPYNGNPGFAPVDSVVAHWYRHNQCFPLPDFEEVPDINTSDNCTATHFVWLSQSNPATVELYKINGGGHSWPGAIINLNTTNMDFSAAAEIWRFFSQFRLSDLQQQVAITQTEVSQINVYPNPACGYFNIQVSGIPQNALNVQLYDLSGRIVLHEIQKENNKTCSINNLSHGIYIYSINSGSKTLKRGKLIIE